MKQQRQSVATLAAAATLAAWSFIVGGYAAFAESRESLSVPVAMMQEVGIVEAWDGTLALESWEIISAFLLPIIMAVIIQSNWSRGLQATATFAVSVIWTIIKQGLGGDFGAIEGPWAQTISSGLTIFALTIPFYLGLWKPLGVAGGIEKATNFTPEARRAAARKGT